MKIKEITIILFMLVILNGCAKKTIIPEVNITRLDAEQALIFAQSEISEASDAGINVDEPDRLLQEAKSFLVKKDYLKVKEKADEAAEKVRYLKSKALLNIRKKEEAKSLIDKLDKIINETKKYAPDTTKPAKMLAEAKAEYLKGNYTKSLELLEEALVITNVIRDNLDMDTYIVGPWRSTKDCLWNIAAKKNIYNDPWKWKKIYMANKTKIKNPDLIYPQQVLKIPKK